jgi:hypothetical protein
VSAVDDRLEAAHAGFRQALADARSHLARVAATPVHTPEQREELAADARAGQLGPQMRELAERIDAGETSWGEVFEGGSPHADLLLPHLTRMEEQYADHWRVIVRADLGLDPDPKAP